MNIPKLIFRLLLGRRPPIVDGKLESSGIKRPVLISRFDAHSDEAMGATVLSMESQAKSLSTMIMAPVLGLAVDLARNQGIGASEFWPIGIFGLLITLGFYFTAGNGKP